MNIFLVVGCAEKKEVLTSQEKAISVKTVKVETETFPEYLSYIGNVKMEESKKYSFKTAGKLASVAVEKGDYVSKGDEIARLDTTELQYAVEAAIGQYHAVKASYDKAVNGATQDDIAQLELSIQQAKVSLQQAMTIESKAKNAFFYIDELHKKQKVLFEDGLISENDYNQATLERDIKKQDYENAIQQTKQAEIALAKAEQVLKDAKNGVRYEDIEALEGQVQQALANLNVKRKMLGDAVILAESDGYVIDTPIKVGELVSPGYPVAVVRSPNKLIEIGLTQKDVKKVEKGTEALLSADGLNFNGKVSYVSTVPDQYTRTYSTELQMNKKVDLPIGYVVHAKLAIGKQEAIGIPITSVLNDGERDYVYVMDEGRAKQKEVVIKDIRNGNVLVTGLKSGDLLIIEGIKKLRPGSLVKELIKKIEKDLPESMESTQKNDDKPEIKGDEEQ